MTFEKYNKPVIVAGIGKSGIAACGLLKKAGVSVYLYDDKNSLDEKEIEKKFGDSDNIRMFTASIPDEELQNVEYAVLSPGIPVDSPTVMAWKERNINIIGEVELAYTFEKGEVAAITGTNGKTTTTSLLGAIMKKAREHVSIAGNIGFPYTETVTESCKGSCTVLEISSFQLETIDTFRPVVSAVLNITPDHLNRHHTMEKYIEAKLNIAKNQTEDDYIVLNYEDEVLREYADKLTPQVIFFSSSTELSEGIYLKNGEVITLKHDGQETEIVNIHDLKLLGMHNYENVMAAVAMAWKLNVSFDVIKEVCEEFTSVEHRIEYVCDINDVKYYNDSKGTNPDAAIKGITSMVRPTYLIGGGYDKQSDFTEWVEAFGDTVKELVLIGATKKKIAATCDKVGFKNYKMFETLRDAVVYCKENAQPGDAVLLSPACASWDMFDSYEQRVELFKKYVKSEK